MVRGHLEMRAVKKVAGRSQFGTRLVARYRKHSISNMLTNSENEMSLVGGSGVLGITILVTMQLVHSTL